MSCGVADEVRVRGLRLRLHRWGSAERAPALLLHSLAAHGHWWDWAAPLLAERYHPIALDLRGHGGSDWAEPAAYHFDDYVADLVAVIDALGLRAPLVAGHSMGGYLGALLAARHPDRVGALVITDILTGWSEPLEQFAQRQAQRPSAGFASRAAAGERFRLAPPDTAAPDVRVRHLGETGVTERRPGVWEYAFDRRVFLHPPPDPWPFLPAIRCPALVVRGEKSAVMDAETCRRVAAAVPRGRAAELPGAFHHLIVDDPDGYARLLAQWQAAP